MKKPSILLLIIFGLVAQCTKETSQPIVPKVDVTEIKDLSISPTVVSVTAPPSYPASTANYFDWETPDFVPYPTPGPPSWMSPPLVPWASGTCIGYPWELMWDHKKSEGWEMIYNVFTTQSQPTVPYFILYNKYRGLMRMYWNMP